MHVHVRARKVVQSRADGARRRTVSNYKRRLTFADLIPPALRLYVASTCSHVACVCCVDTHVHTQ